MYICECVFTRPSSLKPSTGSGSDQSKHTHTHTLVHKHTPAPLKAMLLEARGPKCLTDGLPNKPNKHNTLSRPSSIPSIWPCCNLQHTYLIEMLLRSGRAFFCVRTALMHVI